MLRRRKYLTLPASLLFGLSVWACQPEADSSPGEDCGAAIEHSFEGQRVCIYRMPIIETRFECPSFAPHAHRVGQGDTAICSEQAELPEGFEDWVDQQVLNPNDPVMEPEQAETPETPEEPVGPVVTPDPAPECTQGVGPDCVDVLDDASRPRYSDQGLAVRLAELLWRDAPDAALTQAAQSGGLSTRAGVRAEVARMMADPRFEANMDDFWVSYLQLEHVLPTGSLSAEVTQDARFSAGLPGAMLDSALATLAYVTLDQVQDVRDVWTSRSLMLTGDLGVLYQGGLASGATQLTLITAPAERAGILTHPAVLSKHSKIFSRGVYVSSLRCVDVPPAPDAIDPLLLDEDTSMMSRRERYDNLVAETTCAGCHGMFDPPGHALYGFDALGGDLTTDEEGFAIDTAGEFERSAFAGSADFGAIMRDDANVSSCMTLRLVEHLTSPISGIDPSQLAPLVEQEGLARGFTMPRLIEIIATSDAMIYRP